MSPCPERAIAAFTCATVVLFQTSEFTQDELMVSLTGEAIVGLSVAGLLAGFINTIAGGGSLLTLPALMLAGLPADIANGTNRVGVLCQSASAMLTFRGGGQLQGLPLVAISLPTLVGATLGALAAAFTPNHVLEPVLLASMVVMAVVLMARKTILLPPNESNAVHPSDRKFAFIGLFAAGFYGGFVQAGLGFFLLAVFGGMLRLDLVRANAVKAVTVFCLTILALGVFVSNGLVDWLPGLIIGVAGIVGATVGARFAVKTPPTLLRGVVLVAVCSATIVLLLR